MYAKGLKSMLTIMKEAVWKIFIIFIYTLKKTEKKLSTNKNEQSQIQISLFESPFFEFPHKIQKFIQHPFKPFLLNSYTNFSYEVLNELDNEKIQKILYEFLEKWGVFIIKFFA